MKKSVADIVKLLSLVRQDRGTEQTLNDLMAVLTTLHEDDRLFAVDELNQLRFLLLKVLKEEEA